MNPGITGLLIGGFLLWAYERSKTATLTHPAPAINTGTPGQAVYTPPASGGNPGAGTPDLSAYVTQALYYSGRAKAIRLLSITNYGFSSTQLDAAANAAANALGIVQNAKTVAIAQAGVAAASSAESAAEAAYAQITENQPTTPPITTPAPIDISGYVGSVTNYAHQVESLHNDTVTKYGTSNEALDAAERNVWQAVTAVQGAGSIAQAQAILAAAAQSWSDAQAAAAQISNGAPVATGQQITIPSAQSGPFMTTTYEPLYPIIRPYAPGGGPTVNTNPPGGPMVPVSVSPDWVFVWFQPNAGSYYPRQTLIQNGWLKS